MNVNKRGGKVRNKIRIRTLLIALVMVFMVPYTVMGTPLDEVRNLIRDKYIYPVDSSVYEQRDIKSTVEALHDIYSVYMTKEEYEDFINTIDMKFCGIGIYMAPSMDGMKVGEVIEKSPAGKAGMLEGDLIVSVDGHELNFDNMVETSRYIQGDEGTYVKVRVKRNNGYLTFNVQRQEIVLSTVTSKIVDKNIAYIKINSFGKNTEKEFEDNLLPFKNKVDGFIIDLRNNGGGYMDTAIKMAGYFIGDETSIKVINKKGNPILYNTDKPSYIIDKPVVFLINNGTASSSEILSAAIKDYKKAIFIGNTTYGKGVAQEVIKISDGGVLKLTTKKFTSPLGNEINKIGIKPDINCKDKNLLPLADSIISKPDFKLNINNIKKNIKVKFNMALDEKTLNDNVKLMDCTTGEYVDVSIKLENDKEVILTPKIKILKDRKYTIFIDKGLCSKSGEALKSMQMVYIGK